MSLDVETGNWSLVSTTISKIPDVMRVEFYNGDYLQACIL